MTMAERKAIMKKILEVFGGEGGRGAVTIETLNLVPLFSLLFFLRSTFAVLLAAFSQKKKKKEGTKKIQKKLALI